MLVSELAVHDDEEPGPDRSDAGAPASQRDVPEVPTGQPPDRDEFAPAWRVETPVLCLAGNGPLDEEASMMLAQLLGKRGLGARIVPYEAASRDAVASLDVSGIAMVCISYLHIFGTPSHLRYLMQRLRRKLPDVPILVGLWPTDDQVLKEERVRDIIGADYYSTSLREAASLCIEAALPSKVSGSARPREVAST